MFIRNLILYSGLALVLSGCSKKTIAGNPVGPKPVVYSITENFESAEKGAYAAADVTLSSGSWNLDNALIGNLAADLKDGTKSVRMKTGKLSMNFDISGLNMLYIKHGRYGNDPVSTWQVFLSTDGGQSYTQVGNSITETNTTLVLDSFKIAASGKVRLQIRNTGATDGARINLDDITFKGTGDPGMVVGIPDSSPADTVSAGTASAPRGITAGTDAQPLIGDNSNTLLGNPSDASLATQDNLYLNQKYYTESYSRSRATPNWVSWHLDATNVTGETKRLDNFAGFTGLPLNYYQVQSNSYAGSGFDRGHNCPSADRSSSADANSATFLMTNMIPQAPKNNQQTWANFENYLRAQVVAGNEVYIIMGSYGTGGVGSKGNANAIGDGRITVPARIWKVAVILPNGNNDLNRMTPATRVIAINTPNVNAIEADWKKYIVTVREIEAATGYNLLSTLAKPVQDVLETRKDSGN